MEITCQNAIKRSCGLMKWDSIGLTIFKSFSYGENIDLHSQYVSLHVDFAF